LGFKRRKGKRKLLNFALIISGATGTGKTEVALSLVKKIKAEIISADSRQVYKGMNIGTDKVSRELRENYPHHLIDLVFPDELFTVADFKRKAEVVIEKLQKEDKLPVICGGTGLYIRALTHGIFPGPGRDQKLRDKLKLRTKKFLYDELKKVDPISSERIHPNDEMRIIRALEIWYKTGVPVSKHQQKKTFPPPWKVVKIGLCWRERATLYKIIEERVDKMLKKGLVEETKKLLEAGYEENLSSMQALGYRQITAYLKGRVFEEAVLKTKRETRKFAKRQLTWFKKEKDITWLVREDYFKVEEIADKIIALLREKIPDAEKILFGT